MAHSYVKFIP